MDYEQTTEQKLDITVLVDDFLKELKRLAVLGLALMVFWSAANAYRSYRSYRPYYQASASFTVKVANPLYASVSGYNSATAEQMAKTFPYILTSSVLQERVMEELEISYLPAISVSANTSASILTISVSDSDPQRAYDVLNAVITYYPEVAEFVVGPTVLVLLDESGVPTTPVNSRNVKAPAIKGLTNGAVVWLAAALLLALLRNTIHNEEQLKKVLSVPCLGQIPSVKVPGKKRAAPLYTDHKQQGFSESVRLLALRVEKRMEEQEYSVVLVSSAIPGEGKTTVSANLAIAMAKKGKRVLLIDCDLRNPSVAKALNVSTGNSLVKYLNGEITVREMLMPTQIENLFVIDGGSGGASDAAYFSGVRATHLIQASRNLFDCVILDTPPCSLLADASEIAELADCGLMVVRQDHASRDQIMDGAQRLSDCGLPIIGCAFNAVRRSFSSDYGYGYGYGYGGYGYGHDRTSR